MAGVERFELPDDGVRVRSLTAWRHPNIPNESTENLRISQTLIYYHFFLFFTSVFYVFV